MANQSAEEVGARKVDQAARGPRSSVEAKIKQIMGFIISEQRRLGIGPQDVPCPTREEWQRLAAGRDPRLPSATLLSLYATDDLRQAAKEMGGDLRQAYFEAAQQRLATAKP